jgi:hypothetical protein
MGLHLENEVYEKLLKPRQSFPITLYFRVNRREVEEGEDLD